LATSKKHIELGAQGEALACNYISNLAYTIIERNWRHKHAEVDIIAAKDKVLYFFEVKTRTGMQQTLPEASVSTKKMTKLKQAAQEYLYQYPQWKYIQFNIVAITILPAPNQPVFFMLEDVV
jgi:putative endonuclease